MRIQFKWIGLFFWAATLFHSCSNEDNAQQDFFSCHDSRNWSVSSIENRLIGVWSWESVQCAFEGTVNSNEHNSLRLDFKINGEVDVYQGSTLMSTSTYEVVQNANNSDFTLETEPAIAQLYGFILFCDNEVLFFDSYRDGCDNRFRKRN